MFYHIGCSFVNGVILLGTNNTTDEFGGKMKEAITKTNQLLLISSHNEIFNITDISQWNFKNSKTSRNSLSVDPVLPYHTWPFTSGSVSDQSPSAGFRFFRFAYFNLHTRLY